jgi:hypothetical protein
LRKKNEIQELNYKKSQNAIFINIKFTQFNNRPKGNVYYFDKRLLLIWRKPSHYVSLRALFHLGLLALH